MGKSGGSTGGGGAAQGGTEKQGPLMEQMAIVLPGEDVDGDA